MGVGMLSEYTMTNAVINVCVGLHLLMWLGAMLLVHRAGWTAVQSRWGSRLGAEQVGQQAGMTRLSTILVEVGNDTYYQM
jgi:hypothetical protein